MEQSNKRMLEAIEKAKKYLQAKYGGEGRRKRNWLGPFRVAPYKWPLEKQGMEIWALEGSPMRGFIVANYARLRVTVHDIEHRLLKSLFAYPPSYTEEMHQERMPSPRYYRERPRCRKILIKHFQGLSRKEMVKEVVQTNFSLGLRRQMLKMAQEGHWQGGEVEEFYCEGYGKWVEGCPDSFISSAEGRTKPFGDVCLARAGWCKLSEEQLRKNRGRIRYITLSDLGIGIDDLISLSLMSWDFSTIAGKDARHWMEENREELLEIAEKPKHFPFASVTSKKEY